MNFDHDHLIGGCKAEAVTPPALATYGLPSVGAIPRKSFPRLARKQYQRSAGSCTAHGASFVLESDALERTGGTVQLCRLDLYRGSRLIENNGAERIDGGAFPSYVHRWIAEYGLLSEVHGAYDPDLVTTWKPDPSWDAERRLFNASLLPIPNAVDPILAELAEGRCVPFWHIVYRSMTNLPPSGVESGPDGTNLGRHYRAFVGYDLDWTAPGFGTGALWASNWWEGWGRAHPTQPAIDSCSIVPFSIIPSYLDGAARIARGLDVEA